MAKNSTQPSTRMNSNTAPLPLKINNAISKTNMGVVYNTTGGSATRKNFSYIVNPVTNRKVKITSQLGKNY